ncbi:MAG TPA: site-specific tyrosine recombinase [Acidimicrobiales bacterium]|nr:site-specific tyrosine recombinase [Acidimicrobiales bacterium]
MTTPRATTRTPLGRDSEEFLSYLAVEKGRALNSIAAYRRDLSGYEEFLRARELSLSQATPAVIEDWLSFLAASGLRKSSAARALAAVRGLHRFRVDEGGASFDPTEDVGGPKVPQGIPKALSEAEVATLLAAVTGDAPKDRRDRAILELLYATGLRISELAGLSMGDLDLRRRLLIAFGKGSKERVVPYGRYAGEALESWLGPGGRPSMAPDRFARRTDEQSVFISSRGRRMSRQAAWVVVRTAAERCGLSDRVTPHVLRHSCATHMLDHGADIRVVQELLGHASITTTQVYTKVSQERLRSAYEAAHPRATTRRTDTRVSRS